MDLAHLQKNFMCSKDKEGTTWSLFISSISVTPENIPKFLYLTSESLHVSHIGESRRPEISFCLLLFVQLQGRRQTRET